MQQIIKRHLWIVLLVFGLQSSWGFALLGPLVSAADAWQTAARGYDYAYEDFGLPGGPVFLGDIGGPRNIAQEYRRNVPTLYYTYDPSFINFFGPDAMASVDQAFGIMNAVPAANNINLSLYPDSSLQVNYTAQALFLTDIKSLTLHLLVEQMGLADPERFVWALHDRAMGPVCPLDGDYTVVQRNYDLQNPSPSSILYSPYVNDNLYSYFILEECAPPTAFTVPFVVDPEAAPFTAVAANILDGEGLIYLNPNATQPTTLSGGLQVGTFFTGLTRDDVAGLKYIYDTNNVNYELPDPASERFTIATNLLNQVPFPNGPGVNGTNAGFYYYDGTYGYGDYSALVAASLTNSPAVMQALYPGLQIASSLSYLGTITNFTYTQYFTNTGYGSGYPPPLVVVTVTNKVVIPLEEYVTTFANVFPMNVHPTTVAKLQTITVTPNYGAGYPAPPVTNVTTKTLSLNIPSGYFFLLPLFQTNVCPIGFINTLLTNVLSITNSQSTTTSNVVTSTNTFAYTSTIQEVYGFTNYIWRTYPVTCTEAANVPDLYQGIGKVNFVNRNYDSELSQYFDPVTNYYTMVVLTNYQWQLAHFTRVVTQPDLLLNAADQGEPNTFVGTVFRNITFAPSPFLDGLAGPGTIDSPSTFTYDEIGDVLRNNYTTVLAEVDTNGLLSQYNAIQALAWASYDASTNAPELYPNSVSLQDFENQIAVVLSPANPPNGSVGAGYSVQFSVTGGGLTAPFTWAATGSPIPGGLYYGLPPGLTLSSSGRLSGTPTSAGIYDFALTLTDSEPAPRVITWNLSITVQ